MSHPVFSATWAEAFAAELQKSEAYRSAAATWEGSLLLKAGSRGVFLDLWHGTCRAAREATAHDEATADFLLHGEDEVWRKVLHGELEPLFAIMSGKLQLRRGSLMRLTPYINAARELVKAATRVDTSF